MSHSPKCGPSNGTLSKEDPSNIVELGGRPLDLRGDVVVHDVVDWDGPYDVANPQNWTGSKKWLHIGIVSLLALITYVSAIHRMLSKDLL